MSQASPAPSRPRPRRPASRRPKTPAEIAAARGVAALRAAQQPDGCWKSRPDMGPLAPAMVALTEAWLGTLSSDDARRYVRALQSAQRDDGGFELHPGAGTSSLGATAVCRAALKVCGVPDAAPAARRADACVRRLGGYETVARRLASHGEPAAVFCAMARLLPAEVLPPLSPDMAALPWSERMLDGRFHGGVPMVLYACAAVRARFVQTSLLPRLLRAPTRVVARTRLAGYVGQFQNDDGSWNGAVYCTIFALIALEGVGVDVRDPMMVRARAWLESRKSRAGSSISISIFDGEIWETAFSVLALDACGVDPNDEAVQDGARYLERHQCRAEQPRVNQCKRGAPRTGGWAFQSNNDTMPDCDDAGVAIAALARAGRTSHRPSPAIERGVAWLRGMQNPGGGFGSYVHGLPDKSPGRPLFVGPRPDLGDPRALVELISRPPPEYGDPAIADLCGRVLWGLGAAGWTVADPMVARAVAFLERDACPNGSWWGIWNPAYVAGTSFALLGLASVGADLSSPAVKLATRWLLSVQNADGGFGEVSGSFLDPSLAGRGPSMPPLTGIALRALAELCARGRSSRSVVAAGERAAAYLAATQLEDGTWPDNGYVFTIVPPTFYTWGHHRLYYVLFGLGRWNEVAAADRSREGLLPRNRRG